MPLKKGPFLKSALFQYLYSTLTNSYRITDKARLQIPTSGMKKGFDWVTKAKSNTVLYRKMYDPVLQREIYTKLNPKQLLKEVYPKVRALGRLTST